MQSRKDPQKLIDGPLISVVMPCYKMGQFIGEALESVGKQTYTNWEVIAVDDCGPEDGTREMVEKFAKCYPRQRVEFIRHSENRRLGATRNTAVEAALGELVAFLDPDDIWFPKHLELHLKAHLSSSSVDVTGSSMKVLSQDGIAGWPDVWGYSDWEAAYFPSTLSLRSAINPSVSVIKKVTFEKCGGFDTAPELHMVEDYDLWFRLVSIGATFKIIPEVTGVYRRHENAATAPSQRVLSRRRSQELAAKHYKQWLPSLAFSTYCLSERVGHVENRVKWIEKSLAFRIEGGIRRFMKKLLRLVRIRD